MMKQIFAIGGGGFGRTDANLKLEEHLLSLSNKGRPTICFLPQASSEQADYIVRFYDAFTSLGAVPSWISLFGRVENTWKEKLLKQDIIYVGGGNTKTMLAIWKTWGLDSLLQQAYNKGIIMAGVSAGAICWFESGITDSVWPLGTINALGFLKGSCCPHFDTESERQDVYRMAIQKSEVAAGVALEDDTAAHFIDGELHEVVQATINKRVYKIQVGHEEILEPIILGN